MKRFYATLALVGAVVTGAFAQRSINWKLEVVSPAEGSTIKLNSTNSADSTTFTYKFTNMGPDTLRVADTILFIDQFTQDDYDKLWAPSPIPMGSTINFNRGKIQVKSDDIEDGPGTWCAIAVVLDSETGDIMLDSDTSNNHDCNNITWKNVTVGLNGLTKNNSTLSVFPNPANNEISFTNEFVATTTASVRITDIAGRVVKTVNYGKQNAGSKKFTIDIADLNNGMYYFELVTDETRSISKFTKN